MFSKLYKPNGILESLIKALKNNDKVSVFGAGMGEKLAIACSIDKFLFFVASNEKEGKELADYLLSLGKKVKFLKDSPSFELNVVENNFIENYSALKLFSMGELDALVVLPNIFTTKYPKIIKNEFIKLETEVEADLTDIIKTLIEYGYTRTDTITNEGEFSVKGDIIDIYLYGSTPYRITFDFDKISTIKEIDLSTMLALKSIDELVLSKNKIIETDSTQILEYLKKYKNKSTTIKETIEKAEELIEFKNYENNFWFSSFSDLRSVWEFCPSETLVIFSDAKVCFDDLNSKANECNSSINELIKAGNLLPIHENLKVKVSEILEFNKSNGLLAFQHISNANRIFNPNRVFNLKTLPVVDYSKNSQVLNYDLQSFLKQGYTTVLCAKSNEGANRVLRMINKNLPINVCQTFGFVQTGGINIVPRFFPTSFAFVDEKLVVIGAEELLGKVKKEPESANVFKEAFLPEEGDFVVHTTHGIGKCLGIKSLNLSNAVRDYVVVEYKNLDKLYLPVENIESISKYVGSEKVPSLSKLGGSDFQKVKDKVKTGLKAMAFDLIKLYAEREKLEGYKYPKDDELMLAFENSFGFEETIDQLKAIADIKADMEAGKLMDRLVCGDVGFGKTEVALRSAFKTICAGKKVAFLCPTTILSEQHYNTALIRMKNFGVRVEVLNRFKSKAEEAKIKKDLEEGKIDLIIGTHKLLSSKLKIKNLGLLILDEEQKFGVEDKEKLKNLKKNLNVLTLSATPIPRTLHISMVGIRDMSVIETPPVCRIPASVQVTEYNDYLLKTAIEKELGRGGQVLIVYNRVESIYQFAGIVKMLAGDNAKIGVAHGQMEEKELENEIFKLYNNETNVLIATSLIENGVDLPNANTLIVINADMLGLSQLYQLKGRIGRSDRQAYAYFTYDGRKLLTETAYKRLQAITEFSSMGSGFKIALRDLEIRGAGNVLGKEQHGHMQKVGYAMYVSLLNQAVAEAKGEPIERRGEVRIETNIDAYIPNDYISNYQNRVSTYLDISKIDTIENLTILLKKLNNIYGEVPVEVENLCKVAYIKNMASRLNIEKVMLKSTDCALQFVSPKDILCERTSSVCARFKNAVVLNLENLPIIKLNISGLLKDKLSFMISFLEEFFL